MPGKSVGGLPERAAGVCIENGEFIGRRRGFQSRFTTPGHQSSLPRPLAVTARLIGIHAAHSLEDALRVGFLHVG
jgi:hypothetical protein